MFFIISSLGSSLHNFNVISVRNKEAYPLTLAISPAHQTITC